MKTSLSTTVALVLGVTLGAACGKSDGESSGPGKDWSGKPLSVDVRGEVNGVAFSLKAPEGMKLDDDHGSDISMSWQADVDDYFSEPSFTVSYASIPDEDLDGFIRSAMLDEDDVIAKKETLDDGFLLITHTKDKGIVRAEVLKRKGEHHLGCRASQAKDGGVPSPDATLAWLEELCMSLTIEP